MRAQLAVYSISRLSTTDLLAPSPLRRVSGVEAAASGRRLGALAGAVPLRAFGDISRSTIRKPVCRSAFRFQAYHNRKVTLKVRKRPGGLRLVVRVVGS